MALSVVRESVHEVLIAKLGMVFMHQDQGVSVEILSSLKSMAKMLLIHISLAFISRTFYEHLSCTC